MAKRSSMVMCELSSSKASSALRKGDTSRCASAVGKEFLYSACQQARRVCARFFVSLQMIVFFASMRGGFPNVPVSLLRST